MTIALFDRDCPREEVNDHGSAQGLDLRRRLSPATRCSRHAAVPRPRVPAIRWCQAILVASLTWGCAAAGSATAGTGGATTGGATANGTGSTPSTGTGGNLGSAAAPGTTGGSPGAGGTGPVGSGGTSGAIDPTGGTGPVGPTGGTGPDGSTGGTSTGGTSTGGAGTGGATGTGGTVRQSTNGLPWLHVEGNQIKNPSGQTVVLRGVSFIDLGATQEWYGGAQQMIDRLTDKNNTEGGVTGWYPTVIRLPIYPADSTDSTSPNTYQAGSDNFYDQLLRPIVDYCAQKGVYAIIDWHYIGNTNEHRQTTEQFWRYMSAKFANDSHVLFELFNEPVNNGEWSSVRTDMQAWYDVVRQNATDNLVLVGTPNWCQVVGATATAPVNGTNIVYVAHMYPLHWKQGLMQAEISTAAAQHPVFQTEWGFQPGAPGDSDGIVDGTATSYGNPFKEFVEQQKTSWTAWCASYDWFSSMYNQGWSLRTGENGMGGFTKQWLYDKRTSDLPTGGL